MTATVANHHKSMRKHGFIDGCVDLMNGYADMPRRGSMRVVVPFIVRIAIDD